MNKKNDRNTMWIRLVVTAFFITVLAKSKAQQIPLFSQYQMNNYLFNPAVAGTEDYLDFRMMQRYQWRGVTDAPRTFNLNGVYPLRYEKMGIGGQIYTDIVGPTRRTGFQGSYAYHLKINNEMKLGFGLGIGLDQYVVDGTQINLDINDDPALGDFRGSSVEITAKAGLYFYTDQYYVGFAIPQLFNDKLKTFEAVTDLSKLEDHYMLNAGFSFDVGKDFRIEPSLMFRFVNPTPIQFDLGVWGYYKDILWLGITYRTYDAISFGVGFLYNDMFILGYSYDYTVSELSSFSNGSHEIMIGLRFNQNSSTGQKALLE